MKLYETRTDAMNACRMEAGHAKNFTEKAIQNANAGRCSAAWSMADNARMAARCAMGAHDLLWELTGGELTEEEFEAFEAAEIAWNDANRAEKTAAAAVEKQRSKSADADRLWHEGGLRVHSSSYHYWVKQYDTGSEWGIDGGRVSKLCLKRDGIEVANYDRGWDIEPSDPDTELAVEILLHEYNQ